MSTVKNYATKEHKSQKTQGSTKCVWSCRRHLWSVSEFGRSAVHFVLVRRLKVGGKFVSVTRLRRCGCEYDLQGIRWVPVHQVQTLQFYRKWAKIKDIGHTEVCLDCERLSGGCSSSHVDRGVGTGQMGGSAGVNSRPTLSVCHVQRYGAVKATGVIHRHTLRLQNSREACLTQDIAQSGIQIIVSADTFHAAVLIVIQE